MTRSEAFTEVVKRHGYRSINHFCLENKIAQTNMSKRMKDNGQKVELPLLFKWANILHEPIDTMIEIFYPEELEENRKNIEQ